MKLVGILLLAVNISGQYINDKFHSQSNKLCQQWCYKYDDFGAIYLGCCHKSERFGDCPKGCIFNSETYLRQVICQSDEICPIGYKCCSEKCSYFKKICKPIVFRTTCKAPPPVIQTPSTCITESDVTFHQPTTDLTHDSDIESASEKFPIDIYSGSGSGEISIDDYDDYNFEDISIELDNKGSPEITYEGSEEIFSEDDVDNNYIETTKRFGKTTTTLAPVDLTTAVYEGSGVIFIDGDDDDDDGDRNYVEENKVNSHNIQDFDYTGSGDDDYEDINNKEAETKIGNEVVKNNSNELDANKKYLLGDNFSGSGDIDIDDDVVTSVNKQVINNGKAGTITNIELVKNTQSNNLNNEDNEFDFSGSGSNDSDDEDSAVTSVNNERIKNRLSLTTIKSNIEELVTVSYDGSGEIDYES